MNTVYEIMVRGATKSTINSHVILGEFSIPAKVLVTRDCDKIPPLMRRSSKELSAGVIAGMVCACFAVMLAITSFVLWKYVAFHARHVSRLDPTSDSIIERSKANRFGSRALRKRHPPRAIRRLSAV